MSEANLEKARLLAEAWNRRDLDALLDLADPEIAFVNGPMAVEPGTRRGTDEVRMAAEKQWEILSDGRFEVDELFDRGDEVFTLGRLSRRMPGSDARIEEPLLSSCTFRGGTLIRIEILGIGKTEVRRALEAAGLSE